MAGEQLSSADVTERGLIGDRAYALVDTTAGKAGSAKNVKRFGELLRWKAHFRTSPSADAPSPPVRMTLPDGRTLDSDQPDLRNILAETFGPGVALVAGAPEGLILEFAAGTLGGKHAATTQLPISSGAPRGTLFNYAAVHVITSSTLRNLGHDAQRFRPNIIIDSGEAFGFPENSWIGREITIGADLVLRVSIPCPRCVVPTLAREQLPIDPSVLKRVADMNTLDLGDFGDLPCAGVYADVIRRGRILQGDIVQLV
jgi:uncharacterized protein YcbX